MTRSWWTSTRTPTRYRTPFSSLRPVQGWDQSVHGGRREAVHLSLPVGRPPPSSWVSTAPSSLIARLEKARSGGSSCPATSAPGPRCWRGVTTCSGPLCRYPSGRWNTPTIRPSIQGPPMSRTRPTAWSWTLWTGDIDGEEGAEKVSRDLLEGPVCRPPHQRAAG